MSEGAGLALALVILAGTLTAAVARGRPVSEAAVAAVGAGVLVAVGAISAARAGDALSSLAPTVGFLAALLVIADGASREGVFTAIGAVMARRAGGSPPRLLAVVVVTATAVTALLGLDATAVLLTPIVLVTARRMRTSARPHLYASGHLSNSASLLLPIANLTNLLAFHAAGLSFSHFAVLMALPTLGVVAVEWGVLRRFFAGDLAAVGAGGGAPGVGGEPAAGDSRDGGESLPAGAGLLQSGAGDPRAAGGPCRRGAGLLRSGVGESRGGGESVPAGAGLLQSGVGDSRGGGESLPAGAGLLQSGAGDSRGGGESLPAGAARHDAGPTAANAGVEPAAERSPAPAVPRVALALLGATMAGFALSSVIGIAAVWVAAAGALAFAARGLALGRSRPLALVRAAEPAFLVFVLGLGVIVAAAAHDGLRSAVSTLLPGGSSLGALLAVAALSAVLANLVNNLPATLILIPAAAASGGRAALLAMLIGVNVGPNLTYVGSLATLLWRRVLRAAGEEVSLAQFTLLGVLTVPAALIVATVLLWAGLRV